MPEKLTVLEVHVHDATFGPSTTTHETDTDRSDDQQPNDADAATDSGGLVKPMLALVALVAVAIGVRQLLSSRP